MTTENALAGQGGKIARLQTPPPAEMLRSLFEATATATGDDFFRALVRRLAEALQVRQAIVSEFIDGTERARTLAVYFDGRFVDNVEFVVTTTPCERVYRGEVHVVQSGLQSLYPNEGFAGMVAESYLGVPLVSRSGEILGHVVALDDKPLSEEPHDFAGLRTFAARATAELERRRAEHELAAVQVRLAAAERMAVVGRLAAGIAHEINTPLGVVVSNADIAVRSLEHFTRQLETAGLNNPVLDHGFRETVQTVMRCAAVSQSASRKIGEVVSSLKRFTGLDDAEFIDYDVRRGLETALALIGPCLKSGVSIVRDFAEVPKILARPAAINQVFLVLLENAIEAIDSEGCITVSTGIRDGSVCVAVADTGRGIPSEQLATLFDIGFSVKRSRVGMRLGLANALDIVRSHGGDIRVKSQVNKGTEFSVLFTRRVVN